MIYLQKVGNNFPIKENKELKLEMKQKLIKQGFKEGNGITLIALVVTIVILLILAGITINYVFSEGGLFDTAKNSGNTWHDAENSDINAIKDVNGMIGNLVNGTGNGGTIIPPTDPDTPTPEEPKGPNNKPLVTNDSLKEIDTTQNRDVEDEYGNKVVIPKGFKIATDSGLTVPEGIVIEDSDSDEANGITGNQFVWIPVGTVKMGEGKTAEVKLGRYTFDSSGTPNPVQLAFNSDGTDNYISNGTETEYKIGSYYYELSTERLGVASNGTDGLNATAKDLKGFLDSANNNGGYYVARYEASYGSGFDISKNTETASGYYSLACYENAKPLSKKSLENAFTASTEKPPTEGSLWNYITELAASKVSRNMYAGKKDAKGNSVGVESDLMNSYAWDTAIVYIRQMKAEYANFANFTYENAGNKTDLDNTGANSDDKFCNIYDMVANCWEWTTEYSTLSGSGNAYPCVDGGGRYGGASYFTAYRNYNLATSDDYSIVFRPLCYVK